MTEMPKKTGKKFREYRLSTLLRSFSLASLHLLATVSSFLFLSICPSPECYCPLTVEPRLSLHLCLPFRFSLPPSLPDTSASLLLYPAPQRLRLLCHPGLSLTLRLCVERPPQTLSCLELSSTPDLREISRELVDLGTTDAVCPHQ